MDWQSQGPLRIYWSFHSSVLTHEKNAASHQQNVGAGRGCVTAQDLSSKGQCVGGVSLNHSLMTSSWLVSSPKLG